MSRRNRHSITGWLAVFAGSALLAAALPVLAFDGTDREAIIARADETERLHALLVVHDGEPVIEHVRAGPGLDRPANIKSLSKTVLSMLAGMAIDRGVLEGLDQPLVELLDHRVPSDATDGIQRITVEDALSLRAGLRSTSGRYYGRWVQSDDWVAHVLTRPFVAEPGQRMIYSTGTSHLVSAALATASGRSTRELARNWLGEPLNITIPEWMTDPQGIHFGGNEMRLSPRALARIGEVYRLEGIVDGQRILPAEWIRESWTPRGVSPWSGNRYGLGWFIQSIADVTVYYGRGYGGQMLYVIPSRDLTVVMTSDPTPPSSGGAVLNRANRLLRLIIQASPEA